MLPGMDREKAHGGGPERYSSPCRVGERDPRRMHLSKPMRIFRTIAILLLALRVGSTEAARLRIEGLRRTDSLMVASLLAAPGRAWCDSACLASDMEVLDRLGVFAGMEWERRDSLLVYRVRELPPVLPVPNGRLSDEEGISIGGGLKAPNLLGRAISGEFLFLWGHSREFQASLTADRMGEAPVGFDVFAGRTDRPDELRAFTEESHTLRGRLEYPTDHPWRVSSSIQVLDLGIDRDRSLSGDGRDLFLSGTFGLVHDTRDRRSLVRRGTRAEVSVERVGADADGWELLGDFRWWHPVGKRWTLHAACLSETQRGILGPWRTFLLGGGNTVRSLTAGSLQGESETIATLEIRYLAWPVRSVVLLGQNLYWGSEVVLGSDAARVGDSPWRGGPLLSWDHSVPFVDRVRVSVAANPEDGWKAAFSVGLFEKSTAQRFRVR